MNDDRRLHMRATIERAVPTHAQAVEKINEILASLPTKIRYTEEGAAFLTQSLIQGGMFDVKVSIATCTNHPAYCGGCEAVRYGQRDACPEHPGGPEHCEECAAVAAGHLVIDFPEIVYARCPFCDERYQDTQGHRCNARAE